MTNGLYGKYLISKADGSELDSDAKYFVLRYDAKGDSAALSALFAYAEMICDPDPDFPEIHNPELARDLRVELGRVVAELVRDKRA